MKSQSRPGSLRIAELGFLAVYVVANVYPFLWMVSTSFKTREQSYLDNGLIPSPITGDAYATVASAINLPQAVANSVLYSGMTLACVLLIYPMAGFVLALIPFRGSNTVFAALVSGLLVPVIVLLVPIVILVQEAHLLNTWLGLLLPTVVAAGPVPLFLMRNYFALLPRDLLDAARIDGANFFGAFRRIYLPLSVPALTTVSILTLVYVWNSYILPSLIISNPDMATLPLALFSLNTSGHPAPSELMAGGLLVILPLIVAFLFLQRYYVAGLTAGATKQ
ncbi:MAG TPA: carbohydrate ABC transporter permease [Pseudolysinimonas sp.]|nr:carbohydrate ABC transporter permease [Pseudolysinimonas sp.]